MAKKTLSLLAKARKSLERKGYYHLKEGERALLPPGLREAVSGEVLLEGALPLVEEAIRRLREKPKSRGDAALKRGDDKAGSPPVSRGVLARLPGLAEGVLGVVLSADFPLQGEVVLVENLEAFYRFDPARLVLLPPGPYREEAVPEGVVLLFRGGGGFRQEEAMRLAQRAPKVYLAFDLDPAGLAQAYGVAQELGQAFGGLLYPPKEVREALFQRVSSPGLVKRYVDQQKKYPPKGGEPFATLWREVQRYGVALPQEVFFAD